MPTAIEEALKKLEGTHLTDRSSVGSRASSSPIDGGAISEGRESDLQARRRSRVPNINVHGAPDIAGGRPRAHTNVNNQHARYSAIYSHPVLSPQPLTGAELALMANMPSDAIPNAIVVKNINFAIKREELLQTITDLGLPLPYAFNYHYEGGVFRGLAFGNFRTAEEAARVIVGLNGVTMLGRTIKVEYKKALPGMTPAECMSRHQPPPPVPTTTYTSHPSSVTFHHDQVSHHYNHQEWQDQAASNKDEIGSQAAEDTSSVEQRDEGVQQQQSTDPAFKSASRDGAAGTVRPRRDTASRMRPQSMLVGSAMQVHAEERPAVTIDLDDKDTRLLYDLISQFRHDKSMVELEFPSALSEHQRQCAIAIAGRFGLKYEVKGAGNHRYIRVYKGLETLLEATEVKRRSGVRGGGGQYGMGVPSTVGRGQLPRSTSGANFQGTAGGGRQRPVSAVFDNFQGGWDPSLVSNRVSMFHQSHFDRQAYHHSPHHHQYDDVGQAYINPSTNSYDTAGQSATIAPTTGLGLGVPSRGRSLTNAQQAMFAASQPYSNASSVPSAASPTGFRSLPPQVGSGPGVHTSGNAFGGYPTRLFGDAVVVPVRQPYGPDMDNNFAVRKQRQMQKQQRQEQLKFLQKTRQRRLSDAAHAAVSPSPTSPTSATASDGYIISPIPGVRLEKPVSKAIPIVDPNSKENIIVRRSKAEEGKALTNDSNSNGESMRAANTLSPPRTPVDSSSSNPGEATTAALASSTATTTTTTTTKTEA